MIGSAYRCFKEYLAQDVRQQLKVKKRLNKDFDMASLFRSLFAKNDLDLRTRLSRGTAIIILTASVGTLAWAIVTGRLSFLAAIGQTLVLSPATSAVTVNQTFPITVQVNTNNLNTVVASAEVRYNPADLALESFSPVGDVATGSVYQYALEEFQDQTAGILRVTRGKPGDGQTNDSDDGFTGQNGTLVTLIFRALRPVTSTPITINQTNSAIIADDRLGTQELDSVVNATVTISGPPAPTLSVSLTANPGSGTTPLTGVDLTATVSGTATGDIRYRFDCTNDGTYEVDVTRSESSHTRVDICSYASPGTYTAKVRVDRQGIFAENTTVIAVLAPTLSVNLSANPSSGTAPLNGVDLTADVSGTATGPIRYRFDCTNDGSYERDVSNTTDPFTATDLCNYATAGTYTARVLVDRQNIQASNTTTITVISTPQLPPPPPPPTSPPPPPPPPPTTRCIPSTNPADYRHVFIRQNGYPTLDWGQSYRFEVTLRNTGRGRWCRGVVNLGTDRARDRLPGFIREGAGPSGWITPNRVELAQASVDPGQEGTFVFWMTVPRGKQPGTYREYFRLVTDGVTWMEDYGIYWDVRVPSLADFYRAGYVSQNGYPTLRRGQSYMFELRLRNTGLRAWERGAVNLGTDRPRDVVWNWIRQSPNGSPSGWLNNNRVHLVEQSVAPGAIGTFRFWYTVPNNKPFGTYRDYFRPVADGITWMEDYGIYWDVTVVP